MSGVQDLPALFKRLEELPAQLQRLDSSEAREAAMMKLIEAMHSTFADLLEQIESNGTKQADAIAAALKTLKLEMPQPQVNVEVPAIKVPPAPPPPRPPRVTRITPVRNKAGEATDYILHYEDTTK